MRLRLQLTLALMAPISLCGQHVALLTEGATSCEFCYTIWLGLQQYCVFWEFKWNRFNYLDGPGRSDGRIYGRGVDTTLRDMLSVIFIGVIECRFSYSPLHTK